VAPTGAVKLKFPEIRPADETKIAFDVERLAPVELVILMLMTFAPPVAVDKNS
jgi:hypothetical protein